MDVHLDLNMTMIPPLDGLQQAEYLKEFGDIYKRLEKRLEPLLVNQEQWKRDKSYLSLTVFYTWTTRRCRSSRAMTSPSW